MSRERNRRILFISGIGVTQRVAQLLSTLITFPLVLHCLGVAGLGIWVAATSLAWLAGMLDFGLGAALLSLLPKALAHGNQTEAQLFVTASLTASSALPMILLAGGGIFYGFGILHPSAPFLIGGIVLALNIPLSIARDIWFGLHKGQVCGYWDFAQTVLTTALLIAGALGGAGVTLMVAAVYAAMLVTNAGSLAHVLITHPALRPQGWAGWTTLAAVFRQGGAFFAITVASCCVYYFDNLFALKWLGPEAAAQMGVALRVCLTVVSFLNIVTQPLWPEFVAAAAHQHGNWLRRTWLGATLGVAALAMAGGACMIAAGMPVLRLWLHHDLHFSPALLWTMAAWTLALNLPRVSSLLLNAFMQLRAQIVILGGTTLAGFVAKYYAAKVFGVAGILAVTPALWFTLVIPAYFYLAWRPSVLPAPAATVERLPPG